MASVGVTRLEMVAGDTAGSLAPRSRSSSLEGVIFSNLNDGRIGAPEVDL